MVKLYYQIYKYDKNGKLIKRTHKKKSKSFVKYFLFHLGYLFSGTQTQTLDVDGNSRFLNGSFISFFNVIGAGLDSNHVIGFATINTNLGTDTIGSNRCGIQIGTGTTPITSTDYALATPIVHGSGSGKMLYYGCWCQNQTTSGSSSSYDIERIFYNGSGSGITVNEMGVYCVDYGSNYQFCAIRDLITPVTIANGEYLKVKYTIQITV